MPACHKSVQWSFKVYLGHSCTVTHHGANIPEAKLNEPAPKLGFVLCLIETRTIFSGSLCSVSVEFDTKGSWFAGRACKLYFWKREKVMKVTRSCTSPRLQCSMLTKGVRWGTMLSKQIM